MRKLLILSLGVLLVLPEVFANNTDTKSFFAGPGDKDVKLPADKVFPMGRRFPFSFYSTGGGGPTRRGELLPPEKKKADTEKLINGGVSMIGPQYELRNEIVETAKKYNVQAVVTVSGVIKGEKVNKRYLKELAKKRQKLDFAAMRKETAALVRELAKNPEIAYWDLVPEERRHWKKTEMAYLREMYRIIKENDPLKRPVFMYEPGHRTASALAKTLPFQDICAKGTYTNYSGFKNDRGWVRYSIEQETEAIKIVGKGFPLLLPEMFRQPAPEELKLIESWVLHDCYCGIANGAKGIIVFSASRRPNFAAWEQYTDAYLKVAKVMSGELGQAVLFGKPTSDIEVNVSEGAEKIELKLRKETKIYPSLSVAQWSWNNARYLLVVNSANTPVKAVADELVYGSNVTVRNILAPQAEKFTAPEGNFEFELKPLQAVCYKIYCE